ncbi:MAG: hypothetical protein F2851_00760 [Actinobacteria bacterium]|uniref:Unannotated protein n=1 Tax=freshwater metagenome TaxID=449393 RepID=A0A6J5YKJ9_9ZZZZ|nr:hypothetical protein [Actinomycetota bacterium]
MKLFLSLLAVASIAIVLSRSLKLSNRYERAPRELSEWNAIDKGIDPTDDKNTQDKTIEDKP